ncbi:MAG: hypothetical protein WC150_05360 [Bacteroidia bacterium]
MKMFNLLPGICFLMGLLLLRTTNLYAQDLIILKEKHDTLKVKVTEVGVDEVKYKLWPVNEKDPVIVLEKKRIRKVILESGTTLNFFLDDIDDPKNYVGQRKHLLKMDIISPTLGVSSFAYEKSIKPGRSYEIGLGLVGLGFNAPENDIAGAFLRVGYKFINTPDVTNRGMRFSHLLKGGYVRPELIFINYTFRSINSPSTVPVSTYRTTGGAFIINFGKQYVFSNIIAVDIFAGLGVGSQNKILTSGPGDAWDLFPTGVGFLSGEDGEITPAFQCGLKMGVLLGGKNKEKK